jgi:nucleoside-diphosphate-sugar epimerase
MKNILVTGGSGHLGNYMCPFLKAAGFNVASFDKAPQAMDSRNAKAGVPFVMGSLSNLGDCLRAISFAQPDAIVHLGAVPFNTDLQPPFDLRYQNPKVTDGARHMQMMPEESTMEANVMGAYCLMDAARRLGVKKVVAASSFFAVGIGFRLSGTSFDPISLPIDEEHPLLPEDTYSLSKALSEEIYKAYARAYGMSIVAMRLLGIHYFDSPFMNPAFYGIHVPPADEQNKGWLVSNTYQYVDARDICNFTLLALKAELGPFEAFYLATDTRYTEPTTEAVKNRWPFLVEKAKGLEGTEGLISIKKAQRMLGYKPAYSWRENKHLGPVAGDVWQ